MHFADINECMRPEEFPCHGECKDTDGSYECKCPPGYQSDGDPKEKSCHPKLPHSAKLVIGIHTFFFKLFFSSVIIITIITRQNYVYLQKKYYYYLCCEF